VVTTKSAPSTRLLTGNAAAAWGARLARVDYIPAFPITPQTEIIESLSHWCHDGELAARFVTLDGEHSMVTAAGAAAATGVRTFTATSSQGLLYALEVLYTVSGWRVPFVLVNVSRGLGSPVTLGPDHNDVLAARDSGFLQLHAETCQEVLDSVLFAYRIAEDERVQLPVLVNLDGFFLSFTREPVEIPTPEQADGFLPPFESKHPTFRASRPVAQGVAVLDGNGYSYFRYQLQRGHENALTVFAEVAAEFEERFGRQYEPVECYRMEDAETALLMIGSFATKGKAAVDRWRAAAHRVGLVRPRVLRPWPARELARSLGLTKEVGVIDQNLSPGLGGVLYQELAGALINLARPPRLRSFVSGLGGKDIDDSELDHVLSVLESGEPQEPGQGAELLLTEGQFDQIERVMPLAGKPATAGERSS
jgi:pyruvate ferredoxin oxidoreductase alpha subunit